MSDHFRQWSELAPRGLLLIGAGISIIGQATILKSRRKRFLRWAIPGTLGLIVFNAGIAVFAEAVKHRTLYELNAENSDTPTV
jgi:hypothetical protein